MSFKIRQLASFFLLDALFNCILLFIGSRLTIKSMPMELLSSGQSDKNLAKVVGDNPSKICLVLAHSDRTIFYLISSPWGIIRYILKLKNWSPRMAYLYMDPDIVFQAAFLRS